MTTKVAVDLHGAAKTMLTTLYLKSLDAALPHPVLGDRFAPPAVERLDVDWSELGVTARWAPIDATRHRVLCDDARGVPVAAVVDAAVGLLVAADEHPGPSPSLDPALGDAFGDLKG